MLRLYCRLQVTACYFPFQFSAQFQRYRRPLRRQLKRPPCVTQPSHSVTATLLLPYTTTPLFFPGQPGISSTICKQSAPRSREITTPAPHHSIFTGRMLFLTPNRQCQSTECSSLSHCISCATRQRRILRSPHESCDDSHTSVVPWVEKIRRAYTSFKAVRTEVTSQNPWLRYDRHFVGKTWHSVWN